MNNPKIYLTNPGKYNEGYLIGEWLELPATDEEIAECKSRIGIDDRYEEWRITDYAGFPFRVDEYADLNELSELVDKLLSMTELELQVVSELTETRGYTWDEAMEKVNSGEYILITADSGSDEALGRAIVKEGLWYRDIPEHLRSYLDFEKIGRLAQYEGGWQYLRDGYWFTLC